MMLIFLLAAIVPMSSCRPAVEDHIRGRDLAAAVPELVGLAADSDFGLAPLPGNMRVFQARELKRIAVANHIPAEFDHDVCFAWATKPLSKEIVAEAMKKALAPRPVRIEILDQSAWPVPEGEIQFPRSNLTLSSLGVALWHGSILYASTRRFDIWARARISVSENHVVTTEKLASGRGLNALQLKSETYDGALTRDEPFTSIEQVVGLIPKFDLPAGTLLTRQLLEAPHEIERGETLTVVSQIGSARVEAACLAEESGRTGEIISVHNVRSGRRFRALVESKGRAVVASTDALGLLAADTLH